MRKKKQKGQSGDPGLRGQLVGVGTDSGNHVVGDGKGIAVQFFLDGDLSDPATPFIARQNAGMALQLRQSHGWLDGTLDASSLDDAKSRYMKGNKRSWPRVFLDAQQYVCVDRHGTVLPNPELRVKMEDIRVAGPLATPQLSVLFIRWGGAHRMGEGCEVEAEGIGGWGSFGSPPSDWYLDAVVTHGVLEHPLLGGTARDCEVLSLFLGCDADLRNLGAEAGQIAAMMRGRKAASFWMLWPADFPTDWQSDDYVGYVTSACGSNTCNSSACPAGHQLVRRAVSATS
jgi:hypothetical protein